MDIDFKKLPDEIWWGMCDVCMSPPVTLEEYGRGEELASWVYFRKYGVFPVMPAKHPFACCLIVAWENGFTDISELEPEMVGQSGRSLADYLEAQDFFLENFEGSAFLSSVSSHVRAGSPDKLNVIERRAFGRKIIYLNDVS